MLQVRKITKTENGEYVGVFGQGNANIISGADALAQILTHQLLTVKGELLQNVNYGVSWFEHDDPNTEQFLRDSQIKRIIMQNPYVERIMSFSSNLDRQNNIYNVEVKVQTSEGLLTLNL